MGTITVSNLGKAYKQYPNRWARLAEWMDPRNKLRHQLHWVLRDINIHVQSGEAVGIIGINGAGKSTLLKLITGTIQPTTGVVSVTGRVAALLELGMGFHPDFTGRQNVYMAGQLLGLGVDELMRLMPEIEEFAEIGDYIDQPVRVYSSGMQMRLAFSVATVKRPDILIVDEALSVGDAYFQHKSFDRIRKYREQGTTLLLVSHDKGSVQAICDRSILLDSGCVVMEGEPESVMDFYNAMLAKKENYNIEQKLLPGGKKQTISGTGEASVSDIVLLGSDGYCTETVNVGESVTLRIVIDAFEVLPQLVLGYGIKDRLGQIMYGTNTFHTKQVLRDIQAGDRYVFNIEFQANLGPGAYSVQTSLVSTDTHLDRNYEWRDLALIFNVVNTSRIPFAGSSWLEPKIQVII